MIDINQVSIPKTGPEQGGDCEGYNEEAEEEAYRRVQQTLDPNTHLFSPDYDLVTAVRQGQVFSENICTSSTHSCRVSALMRKARRHVTQQDEFRKWDTSEDREDHMEAGDYKRVWAHLHPRQGDHLEEIARYDVYVAKSLPYAVDDRPLPLDGTEHAVIERAVLMQLLKSIKLELLPKKVVCGRSTGGCVRLFQQEEGDEDGDEDEYEEEVEEEEEDEDEDEEEDVEEEEEEEEEVVEEEEEVGEEDEGEE